MRFLGLFLFLAALGIFSSCSSTKEDIPERYNFKKINCYVRYMAQRRELQAEMTFRTDSTAPVKGQVLLNNEPMQFKRLPKVGIQYRLLKDNVNFENAYEFEYQEKDGSAVQIPVSIDKFQSLRVASDGISKKIGGILTWDGPALSKEDGLVFIFTDSEGSTFQINHIGITKGNKFEILPEHSARLALGEASLLCTRKRTVIEQDSSCTKLMNMEYYLPAIKFEVKE